MRFRALALLALFLLLPGCGDDDDDQSARETAATARAAKGVFVGTVEGTHAYIGLKSDGKRVGGYLCNGREGVSRAELVSVWLDPTALADGKAELRSRKGELVGSVTFSDGKAAGQIGVAGEEHRFSAEAADTEAGIGRKLKGKPGKPGSIEDGWVVLNDGSFRGARTVSTQSGTSSSIDSTTLNKPGTLSYNWKTEEG